MPGRKESGNSMEKEGREGEKGRGLERGEVRVGGGELASVGETEREKRIAHVESERGVRGEHRK